MGASNKFSMNKMKEAKYVVVIRTYSSEMLDI